MDVKGKGETSGSRTALVGGGGGFLELYKSEKEVVLYPDGEEHAVAHARPDICRSSAKVSPYAMGF